LQPLEIQVLVALALQDSLVADPAHRTGTDWLSRARHLERWVVEEIVGSLELATSSAVPLIRKTSAKSNTSSPTRATRM
jgi:hypothetical protein